MTFLILFLAAAAALAIEALRLASHDGRGSQRPPASHVEDARFRSPAASGPGSSWPGAFWSPGAFH